VCAYHTAAPYSRLYVVESPDASYFSMSYCATVAARYAQVVSMSYGTPDTSGAAIDDWNFYAKFPRTMFVAASGDAPSPVNIPSADDHVLSVGAVEVKLDAIGQLIGVGVAKWSGRGVSDDFGRRHLPDVVGPGGRSAALYLPVHGVWEHVYGTSEAAPIEAAIVADQEAAGGQRWDAPEYRAWLAHHRGDELHPRGPGAGYGFPDAAKLIRDSKPSIDLSPLDTEAPHHGHRRT
jgi:hypothetical protein